MKNFKVLKKLSFILFIFFVSTFLSCEKISNFLEETTEEKKYLLLYTNDEHGYFYAEGDIYRAAVIQEMWEEEEKKCPECHIIKISGGDNYTGAAVSSVFRGESTAKIFKIMGYDVAALGNHEFDFGLEAFRKNEKLSGIEYLAANLMDGNFNAPFGTDTTLKVGNTVFGITGLTTGDLKRLAFSKYLDEIHVVESENVVERNMRNLSKKAAVQLVVTHQSLEESVAWAEKLHKKPLVIFNAHSHESYLKNIGDTLFVQAGKNMKQYAKVEITRDMGRFYVTDAKLVEVRKTASFSSEKSQKIRDITNHYNKKLDKIAGQTIIKARRDFSLEKFQKLYACSLKHHASDADIGMSNPGGFRHEIRRGDVKLKNIISMLPFENRVVISKIYGRHLPENLELAENSICGAQKKEGNWYIGNKLLNPEKKYKVVIHEFMHSGGDFFEFRQEDTESTLTSVNWRTPLISYLKKASSRKKTLEKAFRDIVTFMD